MKNSTNVVDTLIETQKKAAHKVAETTKKIYGENPVTEAVEKGSEMYNEWLNKQKATFDNVQSKTEKAQAKSKESFTNSQAYFNNWLEGQMNATRNMWEMNQNFMKGFTPNAETVKNPMDWFNNNNPYYNMWTEGLKNYNNFINQADASKKWFDLMNQYNPFSIAEKNKDWFSSMPNLFSSYYEVLNNSLTEFQKNFNHANTQDIYSNIANNAVSFGKFVEIWAPFWKSIQEKTFNAEAFKANFNFDSLKEMTDKMFSILPESVHTHFNQMVAQYKDSFKSLAGLGKEQWGQAKDFYNSNNFFAQFNPFVNGVENYDQFSQWFKGAVSPIAKMVTPNQYTKSAAAWSAIYDKMAVFSVKNAELQYLMYQQSAKVMEALVDRVIEKIGNDEQIDSLTALYQEWLNTGDAIYVQLFESDEYSKLMAEVSSLQLKLKKDIDTQLEQYISQYPVATKSELDELYKIIYDLKKEVRQLEKMLELDAEEDKAEAEVKTTTKRAAKK
ncbi:MAG: hypothetical protein KL787_06850 [Taibaiella sp.]|nr:hypothetical protein [Taibaiella sp.]